MYYHVKVLINSWYPHAGVVTVLWAVCGGGGGGGGDCEEEI